MELAADDYAETIQPAKFPWIVHFGVVCSTWLYIAVTTNAGVFLSTI